MKHRGFGLVVVLAAAIHTALHAQPRPADAVGDGLPASHAVGYYDPRIKRVVAIGGPGDPQDGNRDSVWSWSGARWEYVTDAGPPGRVNAAAAYAEDLRAAVVAGGSRKTADGATWQVVNDSWAGDPRSWRRLADVTPRDHHALVEDGRSGVLLFGGIPADRSGPWPTDTWRLQGRTWVRVSTDGPAGRGRTALAYDSRRHQVVLFGGVSAPSGPDQAQTFLGDTWVWSRTTWRQVASDGPPGRYAHGMVFDERAGVVLVYGGAKSHRDGLLTDMWQWDGQRWTEIPLTGANPGTRYQPAMIYDRARGRTVLFGGRAGSTDTWEWEGHTWRQLTP